MMETGKTLKERLHAGEPLIGCFVMLPSPSVVELVGYSGFDFAILDQEHGPAGRDTLENQIRAAEASGIEAIVRVPLGTLDQIQHALDSGAGGIIVPHVMTAEGASAIARAAHYPPAGRRGIATTARAGRHGTVALADHLQRAASRTLVIPQIEDREALDHVAAIASTPGIDAIFIGPADLSMSLGQPGNPTHPDVVRAVEGICSDSRNTPAKRAMFARSVAEARMLRSERGIDMICLSTTSIFSAAMRELAEALRQ